MSIRVTSLHEPDSSLHHHRIMAWTSLTLVLVLVTLRMGFLSGRRAGPSGANGAGDSDS